MEDIDGEACIATEGLLMYFTDSEAGVRCDNVRPALDYEEAVSAYLASIGIEADNRS